MRHGGIRSGSDPRPALQVACGGRSTPWVDGRYRLDSLERTDIPRASSKAWAYHVIGIPRRLSKYLCEARTDNLKGVRSACRDGRVTIVRDGKPEMVRNSEQFVFDDDVVFFDEVRAIAQQDHFHAILHKPAGVVSTARSPDGQRDLSEWLAQWPSGTMPSGRLDRETTGLLLFTTDGDLSDAIRRPDQHVTKRYWLWLDGALDEHDPRLAMLVRGVDCAGTLLSAKSVLVQASHEDSTEVELALTEGKNRQIRRMCRAAHLKLLHLHRIAVGPIELAGLASGMSRPLTQAEINALWRSVGGSLQQRQQKLLALRAHVMRARAAGKPETRLEDWLNKHEATPPAHWR